MDKIYCYPPDYQVLKNKLDLIDSKELDIAERFLARQRIEEGCPSGNFDLEHIKAIHHHIFQDVYDWAGEVRKVDISKGESSFLTCSNIDMGMNDVHKRIVKAGYFEGSSQYDFAKEAAEIIGDVNYVHPFREGNGRTQLQYLKQLAERAGHQLDLSQLNPDEWIKASIAAQDTDYGDMVHCIWSITVGGSEYHSDSTEEDETDFEIGD